MYQANITWYLMYLFMSQWCKWRIFISNGRGWWNLFLSDGCGVALVSESTWIQTSSCSVPVAEKTCLSYTTTYFQSVTDMQSSVRVWLSLSLSFTPCLSGPKNILILTQSRKETCSSCSCVFKCPVQWGWHCCRKLSRGLPGHGV